MELPLEKLTCILNKLTLLTLAIQWGHIGHTNMWSLLGHLQHVALALPARRCMLAPLYTLLHHPATAHQHTLRLHQNKAPLQAIIDICTLLQQACSTPTLVTQLVLHCPSFMGFCDASGQGCGGVWLSHGKQIHPLVWRLEWPTSIKACLILDSMPHGDLTINNLEACGLLSHLLVLECTHNIQQDHVAAWCNNQSMVCWMRKSSSSCSTLGQCIIWAILLWLALNKASPLVTLPLPGKYNILANEAS